MLNKAKYRKNLMEYNKFMFGTSNFLKLEEEVEKIKKKLHQSSLITYFTLDLIHFTHFNN